MDISNKTLAMFLVAAIVLSLGGTLISLNKLNNIVGPTALATQQTGTVNFSIYETLDISISNATLDFGRVVVNASQGDNCQFATLSNNGTTGENLRQCWVNDTWTADNGKSQIALPNVTTKIMLQNDGNLNITLNFESLRDNAANFIGNCTNATH